MKNRVKEIREKLGLKQVAVAQRTGIDRSVLSLIENKWKEPNADQAERIRLVLGPDALGVEQRQ